MKTQKEYLTLNNAFLIVEGKQDKCFLSSFIKGEIITVGGNALPKDTIKYIQELNKNLLAIIMCDPDEAGERIKDRLIKCITNYKVVKLNTKIEGKHNKYGIAEAKKPQIIEVLNEFLIKSDQNKEDLRLSDILDFNNDEVTFIKNCFNIGNVNKKTMIKRLNMLGIRKEDIIRLIEKNGNK